MLKIDCETVNILNKIKDRHEQSDGSQEYLDELTAYIDKYAPEEVMELYNNDDYDNDIVREYEEFVFHGTPFKFNEADRMESDDNTKNSSTMSESIVSAMQRRY